MSEPTSRQELGEAWEGEHCNDCGRGYDDVYSVADKVWALIHERAPAGLLCPQCALARLDRAILDAPPEDRCEVHGSVRADQFACESWHLYFNAKLAEGEPPCQFQTYVRVKVSE